ncbi:MAG: hypothetical protein CMF61_00025 [Magnetococcales bacterium]|nr:hypothetical protein [Magnetococcales bacterium]
MSKIKVNLTSKYFTESQHISIIETMLADLIQKHPSMLEEPLDHISNQILICECDQKATKLDSNGVEAPATIENHYFYAFFTPHTKPKDPSLNFATDIMVDYLGIRQTGSCPIRIKQIGKNKYNATDCPGCNCSTRKTKH